MQLEDTLEVPVGVMELKDTPCCNRVQHVEAHPRGLGVAELDDAHCRREKRRGAQAQGMGGGRPASDAMKRRRLALSFARNLRFTKGRQDTVVVGRRFGAASVQSMRGRCRTRYAPTASLRLPLERIPIPREGRRGEQYEALSNSKSVKFAFKCTPIAGVIEWILPA